MDAGFKSTKAQLILHEKMATFGTMAQRVSHEIQNPLNLVNNFTNISEDLAKEILVTTNESEKTEITNQLLSILTRINMHGKRASAIVRQLQRIAWQALLMSFLRRIPRELFDTF